MPQNVTAQGVKLRETIILHRCDKFSTWQLFLAKSAVKGYDSDSRKYYFAFRCYLKNEMVHYNDFTPSTMPTAEVINWSLHNVEAVMNL